LTDTPAPTAALQPEHSPVRTEAKVIGLVSFAHLLSHVYMLVLPPIFPAISADIGVTYTALGLALTAFAITTGVLQTPVGFLVNRLGGRTVLISGLFLNALAIVLAGFITSFWQLIGLMLLAGIGSSVFHPADYAILTGQVSVRRIGRALSIHTLGGNLGFLFAPPMMVAIAAVTNWRVALMVVGGIGLVLALVMLVMSSALSRDGQQKERKPDNWRKLVTNPVVMSLFVFYVLSSASNSGVVYFSVAAFKDIYGIPVAATAAALTAYQFMTFVMVLPGGWLADKVENHELVLAICFGLSGVLVVICGLGSLPFWIVIGLFGIAGGLRGLVNSSRDVTVRHAATDVSAGTLFGFVTTGFSGGQIIGPTLYGWLLDFGHPQLVFWASAGFSTLALTTMLTHRLIPQRHA
jgi:FSR family fosmidomycin resistance protein-like MFS transporter